MKLKFSDSQFKPPCTSSLSVTHSFLSFDRRLPTWHTFSTFTSSGIHYEITFHTTSSDTPNYMETQNWETVKTLRTIRKCINFRGTLWIIYFPLSSDNVAINRMASVWCLAFSVTRKEKIVYTLIKTQVRGEEALKERSYYLWECAYYLFSF